MSTLLNILDREHQSEHQNILKPDFTKPFIYPKNLMTLDPSKWNDDKKAAFLKKYPRWYVRYKFRCPKSGKLVRQSNIYKNINRQFPEFDDRLKHILLLRDRVEHLLKNGYSPYVEMTVNQQYSIEAALQFALQIKKNTVAEITYNNYKSKVGLFIAYLKDLGENNRPISAITRKDILDYLNHVSSKSSARSRNNTRTDLSTLFSVLEDNELIKVNFIKSIDKVKSISKTNKIYPWKVATDLLESIEQSDNLLAFFIRLVSYNFLRPIEVCRLRMADVNLHEMKLEIKAKNKPRKYKRIPALLLDDFKKLNLKNRNGFVISLDGSGVWDSKETSKRDYIDKRFLKVKKKLDLDEEYTIYSFRHTYITKLHNYHLSLYSETEALEMTRLCTGHETIKALKTYLHNIDAVLASDYSDFVNNKAPTDVAGA